MLIRSSKHISKLLIGVSVLAIGIGFGGAINAAPYMMFVTPAAASTHGQGHGQGQGQGMTGGMEVAREGGSVQSGGDRAGTAIFPETGYGVDRATVTIDGVTYGEDGGYTSFEVITVAGGNQGGGNQGGGGQGGGGQGGGGHEEGGHEEGGHEEGGHEGGGGHDEGGDDGGLVDLTGDVGDAGDDGEESDGRGPHYGQAGGSTGGKPVWAQEGLPEVELGRLNVVRAPEHVLLQAYNEALANFTPEMAEFYSMTLEEAIAALNADFENLSFIDAPLMNLALFNDALDGTSVLTTLGVTNNNDTLLALFLGAASDKTVPILPETAYSVALILGVELTQAEAIALAADAEAIREAILAGHG